MFDPYSEWLGISDERRPPTLYQLLGVLPADADPRAIEAAVNRQLGKVQAHLNGPRSKEAWQIIDEITLAKTTLLDPAKRSAYDGIFGFAKPASGVPSRPSAPPGVTSAGAGWSSPQTPKAAGPGALPDWLETPAAAPKPVAPAPPGGLPDWVQASAPAAAPRSPSPPVAPPPPVQQTRSPAPARPASPPVAPAPRNATPSGPAPAPHEFSLENDQPSSDQSLPVLTDAMIAKSRRRQSSSPMLFLAGGLVAVAAVGGVLFLKMRGDNKKGDPDSSPSQAVADNTGDSKSSVAKVKQEDPRPNGKKTETPPPKKEPKKVGPKINPDPPPKIDASEEFRQAKIFRGHANTPRALAVSPDSKQLLSGGGDGAINSWVAGSEKPSRRKSLTEPAVAVAFLNGGKDAVIAEPGALYVLDLVTNAEKKKFTSPAGSFTALATAPDGQHFVTASTDGQLRAWDATKDGVERTIDASGGIPLESVALTPDGKIAIAGNRGDGGVSAWNVETGTQVQRWKAHGKDVTAMACSPDGKRLVTTGADNLGKVWDLLSGALLLTLKGHDDVPIATAFSSDGSMILTAGVDKTVRAWDASSGQPLRWFAQSEFKVFAMALDPKDRFLIVGLNDGGLQMLFLPIVRPDILPKAVWTTPPKTPLQPPASSSVATALKSIRDGYANDFAQTDPAEQLALFDKLLLRARYAPEEPPARYALFLLARDVAARLGRLPDSFSAIDFRSRWFQTDELEDKSQALKAAGQGTASKAVVEAAIALVEEAEQQARPDIVQELLSQNELFPQIDNAPQLNARVEAAKKRMVDSIADREAIRKLVADLKSGADNPTLNAEYGKHLCFRVGDWKQGLAKLAKSDDAVLKALAKKESDAPTDGKGQAELSKAWLEYAANAPELSKTGILLRAKHWCDKALASDLPAAEKFPLGQRLVEINKQLGALSKSVAVRPGEPVNRKGFNTVRSVVAVDTQWAFSGTDGFTPDGVVLKDDATLTSRFQVADRCRVEFVFLPDGRSVKVSLYGEEFAAKPDIANNPVSLIVERKGDELTFSLKSFAGASLLEKSTRLAGAKQLPTPISFVVSGSAATEPLTIKSIVVTGPVILVD